MALYTEESTYKRYKRIKDLRMFVAVALVEPIIFHPFTVYAAMKGNWEKLKGNKGWGEMTRTGFTKRKANLYATLIDHLLQDSTCPKGQH